MATEVRRKHIKVEATQHETDQIPEQQQHWQTTATIAATTRIKERIATAAFGLFNMQLVLLMCNNLAELMGLLCK